MKTAELHFEDDGVVHLRGTSTPDSPNFNTVLSDTVGRLFGAEVRYDVRTINGGNTLEVDVRLGPPGWQAARKKKQAEANARAKVAKPVKAEKRQTLRKKVRQVLGLKEKPQPKSTESAPEGEANIT